MKQLFTIICTLITLSAFSQVNQVTTSPMCQTSEVMKQLYLTDPKAKLENEQFELFTQQFANQQAALKTATGSCYVIPVVFHVYGTTQSGKTVTNSIIINAINALNNDFHALNSDYNSVHSNFLSIRGSMPDITFALAQIDPNGNPTNGIVYHATASGYGNGSGYDAQIAADAWDNFKYMNVYVQNDLYNNTVYTNSGVAWYPNTTMSNNKTARVVYNGAYLGTNTSVEFASVLTHEFGHWLNLIHTFEGGCVPPNDNVADTPECDYGGSAYNCHTSSTANNPLNCNSVLINAENYMDYAGAYGCYRMFTQGQVTRVYAALLHPARQPLWQPSNLVATGLSNLCAYTGIGSNSVNADNIMLYPNPATNKITIQVPSGLIGLNYTICDQIGKIVVEGKITNEKTTIKTSEISAGVYFLKISNLTTVKKLVIE